MDFLKKSFLKPFEHYPILSLKLHWITIGSLLLFGCAMLAEVMSEQSFKCDPMHEFSENVIRTECLHGNSTLYSVVITNDRDLTHSHPSRESISKAMRPWPKVIKDITGPNSFPEGMKLYQRYYAFRPIIIIFLAILFYVPQFMWRKGVKILADVCKKPDSQSSDDEISEVAFAIAIKFEHYKGETSKQYHKQLLLVECLHLVLCGITVFMFYLTLGEFYLSYGISTICNELKNEFPSSLMNPSNLHHFLNIFYNVTLHQVEEAMTYYESTLSTCEGGLEIFPTQVTCKLSKFLYQPPRIQEATTLCSMRGNVYYSVRNDNLIK